MAIVTEPFRILSLLLCLLMAGPMSTPAWALARPETRVGEIFSDSPKSAPGDLDQTLEPRRESRGCDYDFASGVCKYLYCHADPVNGWDPSGHEFNMTSLMTSGLTIARLGAQVGIRAYAAYDRVQWLRDGLVMLGKLSASGTVDPVALSMWASDFLPGKKIWNKFKVVGNRVLGMSDSLTRVYKAAITGGKRAVEQIGEMGAAAVARKLGMRPTTFEPRYHGIDDIYEQNGKLIIVEAKGGTSTLAERQMSRDWINDKIAALERKGDPWGAKLKQARDSGQLQGMVVTTKIDAGDVVQDPIFELKDFQNIGGSSF